MQELFTIPTCIKTSSLPGIWYQTKGPSSAWNFLQTHRDGLKVVLFTCLPPGSFKMLLQEFYLLPFHLLPPHIHYAGTLPQFTPSPVLFWSYQSMKILLHRNSIQIFYKSIWMNESNNLCLSSATSAQSKPKKVQYIKSKNIHDEKQVVLEMQIQRISFNMGQHAVWSFDLSKKQ